MYYGTRDTQYHVPTQRHITVTVGTVEVATGMVAVLGLLAIVIGVVLIKYGLPQGLRFWNRTGTVDVPISKLDWMAQAIRESESGTGTSTIEPKHIDKTGSVSVNIEEVGGYNKRTEVEAAAIEVIETISQGRGRRHTRIKHGAYIAN